MKTIIYIIILSVLAPFFSAQSKTEAEFLSNEDRVIYYQVSSMCSSEQARGYSEKASLWYQSFTNSGFFDMLINKKFTPSNSFYDASPEFKKIVISAGFFPALNHCFGNDQSQKMLFFYSLLAVDISGKLVSWASDLTLMRALYWGIKGFSAAAKLTSLNLGYRWTWFRVFFDYSMKHPKTFGVSPFKLILPLFLSSSAAEAYSVYAKNRDAKNIVSGKTPEKKDELKNEILYFLDLKAKSTNQHERDDLDLFIKQNQDRLKLLS